jgi:hypothetical protein
MVPSSFVAMVDLHFHPGASDAESGRGGDHLIGLMNDIGFSM